MCPVAMFSMAPPPSAGSTTPIASSTPAAWQLGASSPYPNVVTNRPGFQYVGQWNWGAFLLCPFWLMNHGRVGRGILYIVLNCIPIVSLATLAMAIAYGIKGNQVAMSSRYFADDAQFVAVQNAWRNVGFGVFIAVIVVGIIAAGGAYSHG